MAAVWILASGGCERGGQSPNELPPEPSPPPDPTPVAPRAPRARRGGMDVTFLVTADTHFGHPGIEPVHEIGVEAMNTISGQLFPPGLGAVGEPRGVLVAGDLTEDGWPHEWERFAAVFGSTGKDGRLRYPVYEGIGNHDRHAGGYVKEQVARRHGAARYSWDWDDLHLVCLGEAPDDDDLAWLRADLEATGPAVGVVLYFHYPLEGAFSRGNWFGDGQYRARLHEVLAGYRVLGVFNGHFHASGTYRWKGLDAYLVGSAKHSWHSFAVVRVTDTRMTVASWNYDRQGWWWWHDKPVFDAPGAERRWFSGTGALVGATSRAAR
jgi:hypothetical protein